MFIPLPPKQFNEDYRDGVQEGFRIAESYIKEASKRFYKEVKGGMIDRMATCATASSIPEVAEILDFTVRIDKNIPENEIWVRSKKELIKLKILKDFEEIK